MSGGKSGRGATFSSSNPNPPQVASAVNPSSASVGLVMDGGQHQQPSLAPQILQMPGFYTPGQPQQLATPSELHGLLGDVDQSSHLRQNRWNSKPPSFLQGLKWNRSSNRQMDRPASPLVSDSSNSESKHGDDDDVVVEKEVVVRMFFVGF